MDNVNSAQSGCACTVISTLPTSVFDAFHKKKGVQPHCTQRIGTSRHLSQGPSSCCSQAPGFPALPTSLPAPRPVSPVVQQVLLASRPIPAAPSLLPPLEPLSLETSRHQEALSGHGAGLCGPIVGSCPFSLDDPGTLHSTRRACVCAQPCLLRVTGCSLQHQNLMTGITDGRCQPCWNPGTQGQPAQAMGCRYSLRRASVLSPGNAML